MLGHLRAGLPSREVSRVLSELNGPGGLWLVRKMKPECSEKHREPIKLAGGLHQMQDVIPTPKPGATATSQSGRPCREGPWAPRSGGRLGKDEGNDTARGRKNPSREASAPLNLPVLSSPAFPC